MRASRCRRNGAGRAARPSAGDLRPGGVKLRGAARLLRHRHRHVRADIGTGHEPQRSATSPRWRAARVWCQLFSSRLGGSDLAGLRTRAVRDGDEWVVNGRRSGRSGAHYSDWGILVTRHDPNVPKHKGLTFFFVDMKTPGIEIRPIRQMSGASTSTRSSSPTCGSRRQRLGASATAGRCHHDAHERALRVGGASARASRTARGRAPPSSRRPGARETAVRDSSSPTGTSSTRA